MLGAGAAREGCTVKEVRKLESAVTEDEGGEDFRKGSGRLSRMPLQSLGRYAVK